MAGDAEKSEKPTPRRLKEARQRGQIPRSADLVSWVVVLIASFVVPATVSQLHVALRSYLLAVRHASEVGELGAMVDRSWGLAVSLVLVTAPLLALVFVTTAVGLAVQGGVTLTTEALRPKLERISIRSGLKRLFSAQSAVETAKATARLVLLVILATVISSDLVAVHLTGSGSDLGAAGPEIGGALLLLVRLSALLGVVIGIADYAFQRHKVGKQLMMSKQEVRQESRSAEGDPMLRSRRRALHAKLSRNQMLAAVNDASVVVVNPTHVAVALSYQPGTIPRVVAKGGDELARRIRERAFERGVPVVEARPLARILHDSLPVGAEVPADMYEAVAIVIAFVMRLPKTAVSRTVRSVNVPRSKLGGRDQPPPPGTA